MLVKEKKRFLQSFSVFNLTVIAMCAVLGIAVKPIIVPLVHIITGPLLIPGGAVAGGMYMLFIVIPTGIIGKRGAATLTAAVQAVLVFITGVIGNMGIFSLLSYLLPGIAVDLLLLIIRHRGCCMICCMLSGMVANLMGTICSNAVFFRLPTVPLVLALLLAAFSGGIGGIIARSIISGLQKVNPSLRSKEPSKPQSIKGTSDFSETTEDKIKNENMMVENIDTDSEIPDDDLELIEDESEICECSEPIGALSHQNSTGDGKI